MTSLFERIKSAIPSSGMIIAPYKVLSSGPEYEERLYPSQTWVQTPMRHTSRDDCTYKMFWKLFNYISGHNERHVEIPMTAPVSVFVEPTDKADEHLFTMSFYIPPPFDEDPPLPTDPTVSIERRPEIRVFARVYGGFTNDRIDLEERGKLLASLPEYSRQCIQLDGPYYCAGYDPPLKLFFRRNEIWIPVGQQLDSTFAL